MYYSGKGSSRAVWDGKADYLGKHVLLPDPWGLDCTKLGLARVPSGLFCMLGQELFTAAHYSPTGSRVTMKEQEYTGGKELVKGKGLFPKL